MKKRALWLVLFPVLVVAGCVKAERSENPLSPTVAGPIPGVNITVPEPIQPRDNQRISAVQQPIELHIANAHTNGIRPVSYRVEIATDAGFSNPVFVREGVTPDASGRTVLRLPDALAADRTYYWRTKAEDGANYSDYSAPAFFVVYTPIVFGKPSPQSPIGNTTVSNLAPQLVWANAGRSGPSSRVAICTS